MLPLAAGALSALAAPAADPAGSAWGKDTGKFDAYDIGGIVSDIEKGD